MDKEPEVAVEQPSPAPEPAPETPAPAPAETPAPAPTIAEILDNQPKQNVVPEAAFLDEKKGRKEAEKRAKELQAELEALRTAPSPATRAEISADVSSILDEFGLDDTNKQFFNKLVNAVESKNKGEIEALRTQLADMAQKEQQSKFESIFQQHFDAAMEQLPDYKGVVNPNVIKALSLDPSNKDKTFPEIIQDAYESALPGKRSVEATRPGGTKDPEPIDYDKASTDGDYLASILKDPAKKAEYNATIERRIKF